MGPIQRLLASGRIPDPVLRAGARLSIARRLVSLNLGYRRSSDPLAAVAARRSTGPIAVATDHANSQHYAVAPGFFELVLGPRLKYSSCLFENDRATLAQAEEAMLALTVERSGVRDGMEVLDLGCGWGSLSLWLAEALPEVRVTGFSNSAAQREFILARAADRGLADRVTVITGDVNELDLGRRVDRVVSVEMFEHARNWQALLERVARHLHSDGALFVHTFAHRRHAYDFERGWMADRFFTGGQMPAAGLLGRIASPLRLDRQWWVGGEHYARTSAGWLANLDANRAAVLAALRATEGDRASAALEEWRIFFIAVEELFGLRGGREWGVVHQLLTPAGDKGLTRRGL